MKPYKGTTLAGASRRIQQLQNQIIELDSICCRLKDERVMLAKLAATGPAFFNPMDAWKAEKVRDEILKRCGLNSDGSRLSKPTE